MSEEKEEKSEYISLEISANKMKVIIAVFLFILVGIALLIFFHNKNKPKEEEPQFVSSINKEATIKDVKLQDGTANVYMFWGDGCPHCEEEWEYLETILDDYKVTIYGFETWYNNENASLREKFAGLVNSTSTGVPLTIIGDQYISGYSSYYNSEITSLIEEQRKDNSKDIYREYLKTNQ